MKILKPLIPIALALILPIALSAQDKSELTERDLAKLLKEQGHKIEILEKIITELESRIDQQEKKNELESLLGEARRMANRKNRGSKRGEKRKFYSGLRQHSALNPNISVGGDFYFSYGSSNTEYNRAPSDNSWGTGQFFMREIEIAAEASLDPYSRGKVFLGFGPEGVGVEEGYMEWLNWPLNMNLKLGKFKTQFGVMNRYHTHALPQFDLPLVITNFFGNEYMKGVGVAANFLLPSMTAHVNELDLQVISGGEGPSFTGDGNHNIVFVSHLKNYWDINRATYIELGLSGATGYNDAAESYRTILGGIDLRLKWSPPGRSKYRGLEWWTEAIFSRYELQDEDIDSWGIFSSLQCRLGARWLCSGRFDYSQLPGDVLREEFGGTACIDFWQSEFVFLRLQYTHIDRNFDEDDNRVILQVSWAMGPHKHESY
ncbi:MAG: hypothetical protein KAV42_09810 [Candidatus Krumholzibacteria bacterium]|nr:hypothetical protein [Candidatus Krumholzibacteria bacterium]